MKKFGRCYNEKPGDHKVITAYKNVTVIIFQSGTMFSLVNGIGKQFEALETLQLEPGLSTTLITRSSLKNLENLKKINIFRNEIQGLDEDLLWDLPKLVIFQLRDNKLKILLEKTFVKNSKLKVVNLSSNQLEFLPKNLFKNCTSLQKVDFRHNPLKIIETDFIGLNHIQYIIFDGSSCDINECNLCTGCEGYKNLIEFQALLDINNIGINYCKVSV